MVFQTIITDFLSWKMELLLHHFSASCCPTDFIFLSSEGLGEPELD